MIKINGNIITYDRTILTDPDIDINVYDFSQGDLRRGVRKIKGLLRAVLNGDMFMPFGVNGFYYTLTENTGVKVFYSLGSRRARSTGAKREWKRCNLFYKKGFAVKPIKLEEVKLNVTVDGKKVGIIVPGIVTKRVDLPQAMWDFSIGKLYNFGCLDQTEHPLHNADDFVEFRAILQKHIDKKKVPKVGTKLGDIVYCKKKKRWYLVDCG